MNSHIDESRNVIVTDMGESISVFVPISWKRTGGRKQIVLPEGAQSDQQAQEKPPPLAIALARAYVWQRWIDEGEYGNAKDLAKDINMDPAVVRRVMRLGLLAPRVVERMLDEEKTTVHSLPKTDIPLLWSEQT